MTPIPQPQLTEVCLRAPPPRTFPKAALCQPLATHPCLSPPRRRVLLVLEMPGWWVLFRTPPPAGPRNLLSGSRHALLCGCVTAGEGGRGVAISPLARPGHPAEQARPG